MSEQIPTEIRLACGCDVPYEIGQPIFNYYDRVAGEITELATSSEPDTYGTDSEGMSFPDGKAWWTRTTAGFVDGSRMCCQAFAINKGWHHAAQQSTNQENTKESNMYNDINGLPTIDQVANDTIDTQAAHIVELDGQLMEAHRLLTSVRGMMKQGVETIGEVLHSYAADCDMKDEITEIIEKINEARKDGRFPLIEKITDKFEITITYVVEVQAASEEDAQDKFIDGDYDHLIEPSDYHGFEVEEGC